MRVIESICRCILLLVIAGYMFLLGWNELYPDKSRDVRHTTIDGCRYIKINKQDWKHSTSCDNKCHL